MVRITSTCYDTKISIERIVRNGLREIKIRRIQGRHILIEIPDVGLLKLLKEKDWACLREVFFFVKIEPWLEKIVVEERVSWIQVSGIPLHYWNNTSFKRIVRVRGELISLCENLTMANNFDKMSMLVCTN